jgi:hypothetical protein
MSLIIGLDVSTKYIGYCILQDGVILELSHFNLSNIDNIWWEKVDKLKEMISSLKMRYEKFDKIFIEESLQSFKSGFSSAQILSTLSKFNIITAYLFREIYGISPRYISATHARKLCNIYIDKKTKIPVKEQVVHFMLNNDLKEIKFDLKKTGTIKDYVKDQIDSYVIAKAGFLS